MGTALLMVRAELAEAADRPAFDRWYETEHLPDALKVFQADRAWRCWSAVDSSIHYAFYQFAGVEKAQSVLRSAGMRTLIAEFDRAWGTRVRRTRDILDVVQSVCGSVGSGASRPRLAARGACPRARGQKKPRTCRNQDRRREFPWRAGFRPISGKVHMRIPIIVLVGCGLATAAQAQDQGSVLDRAAGLVSQCIAEQTLAELDKGTAPRQFATVLRDKCRSQEQRFRATLTAGLKKEGSLDPRMVRTVEELLAALREQSVADYADLLKQRPSTKPTRSASNRSV